MIGTRLGQYRLDRLLGRGGMGAVYQATDEMLGRQVAVKVLRTDVTGSPDAEERFRTEARILASLDHPHILRLHGFSKHEDVLYMVTEFVQGETLQHMLESGAAIDTTDALRWIDEVLDALEYAHHLGVVHRDLKPANVLIDTRGRARLLDFGIAKVAGQDGLTRTGHAVGTLLYMAPEQVMDQPIDGRTDLYAFAVLACELLAGKRPYRSSTTAGLLREIVDGPPPEVADLLPPAAAPAAPALRRALARRPSDRPATAASMRDELRAAFDTAAVAPAPADGGSTRDSHHVGAAHAGTSPLQPAEPPPLPPPEPAVTQSSTQHGLDARPAPVRRTWPVFVALGGVAGGLAVGGVLLFRPRPSPSPPTLTTSTAAPAPAPTGDAARLVVPPPEPLAIPAEPTTTTTTSPAAAATPRRPVAADNGAATSVAPESPGTTSSTAVTSPPATPEPAAPAPPSPPAAVAPAVFGGVVYIERIDDEDEEFDVTLRVESGSVVIVDEDEEVRKTLALDVITQATYYTRGPARFALRRSPSHWVRLETTAAPVVLRVNARAVDPVLSALEARGVRVARTP